MLVEELVSRDIDFLEDMFQALARDTTKPLRMSRIQAFLTFSDL